MGLNFFLVVCVILINFDVSYGQISCVYRNNDTRGYTCDIKIVNPYGFNNFTSIDGKHIDGKASSNVLRVNKADDTKTTNVPSIICDKFKNLVFINLVGAGIQTIDENAFKNCKNLQELLIFLNVITNIHENAFIENPRLLGLSLFENQISELSESVFKNQKNLETLQLQHNKISDMPKNIFNSLQNLINLMLDGNQLKILKIEWFLPLENLEKLFLQYNEIEELPRNVFLSLKKLNTIFLQYNKLKVIHSNSFRSIPNLSTVYLGGNQIEAMDENFIDNIGIEWLFFAHNVCANVEIFDNSTTRTKIRTALQNCFDNFDDLLLARVRRLEDAEMSFNDEFMEVKAQNHQLSLTINELSNKVINITAENDKIWSEIENMTKEIQEMRINFENQIKDLVKENEEQKSIIKNQGLEFERFRNETGAELKKQAETLQRLEDELLIWTSRPCSCL